MTFLGFKILLATYLAILMISIVIKCEVLFTLMKFLCSIVCVISSIYLCIIKGPIVLPFTFGFLFSFAGDILLLKPEYDIIRKCGFLSFTIVQICYSIGIAIMFGTNIGIDALLLFFAFCISLIIVIVGRYVLKLNFRKDHAIIIFYTTVLSYTALSGILAYDMYRTNTAYMFMHGFVLFLLSDLVLSNIYYNKGHKYLNLPECFANSTIHKKHSLTKVIRNFAKYSTLDAEYISMMSKEKGIDRNEDNDLQESYLNPDLNAELEYIDIPKDKNYVFFTICNLLIYFVAQYIILFALIRMK